MKVFPLFNMLMRDGVGSAAITLVKAIKWHGVGVQTILACQACG